MCPRLQGRRDGDGQALHRSIEWRGEAGVGAVTGPEKSGRQETYAGYGAVEGGWWPLGTHLVGRIGAEEFTAIVVENPQVKSGRSLQIRSGAAAGSVCVTPTRAAIEATEAYRQAHNLGRGGGITNGWDFWQPKA